MEPDPITENVRSYLQEHFQEVDEKPQVGNFYVFNVKASKERRELRIHKKLFDFPDQLARRLRDYDFAGQLATGDVELVELKR